MAEPPPEDLVTETVAGRALNPFRQSQHFALLIAVVLAFVLGPYLSQFLVVYRGVVIDIRADKMLLAFTDKPPRWHDAPDGIKKGDIVSKELGSWIGQISPTEPRDRPLTVRQLQYNAEYSGLVRKIIPPRMPKGPSVAVLALDGGGDKRVELWDRQLSTIAVGSRLTKTAGSWSPEMVAEAPPKEEPSGEGSGSP